MHAMLYLTARCHCLPKRIRSNMVPWSDYRNKCTRQTDARCALVVEELLLLTNQKALVMSQRYFEAAQHAAIYAKYRPHHPEALSEAIISYLTEKYDGSLDICVDVGCGNGQSSGILAASFSKVLATDISEAQIKVAQSLQHPANVEFLVTPANQLPVKNESVQVITAVQACHWFDLPAFFKEAKRALCYNGALVLAGYSFPQFVDSSQKMQTALELIYRKTGPYWGKGRQSVDLEYTDIDMPLTDFKRENLWSDVSAISFSDFLGYIRTWSGYQQYCKSLGEFAGHQLLKEFIENCQNCINNSSKEQMIHIQRKYFLLMGRNK